jgi:D-alanyl-D-alanine carboxypeptidase
LRLTLLIAVICVSLSGWPARADQDPAYILVDVGRGAVIGHSDSDLRWPPASLTKLMTTYLTFKALQSGQLKLTSPVVVSAHALAQPPSKMGYKVGTVINLDNALKMMIVHSSNDIAMAIAETVGGSEARFVALMNQEAGRLGMNSTRFVNPNGLPAAGQVTSARDLAVLARALWMDYPQYREYFRITAIRVGAKVLHSYNTLLEHYHGTNGMKTGFICASGFNIVATATRNGRTLMAVVLGETSADARAETAAQLLDRGFNGLLTGVLGQSLASFETHAALRPVVDIHDQICGKRRARTAATTNSALEPRFVLMDPIRVYTGNADPVAGQPAAAVQQTVDIPLPRLRPQTELVAQ